MPEKNQLIAALLKAQSEFPEINTDSVGNAGSYSYKYASLPDILKKVLPVLHKNGLTITQAPVNIEGQVWLRTYISHDSGEQMSGEVPLPMPNNWQQWGSGVTYARRYSLTAMLGIAPDDDDDASSAQGFSRPATAAPASGKAGARNLANAEDCPEHGLPWRQTSRGNNAHPIKNSAGDLLGWCDEEDWKEAHEDEMAMSAQQGELEG